MLVVPVFEINRIFLPRYSVEVPAKKTPLFSSSPDVINTACAVYTMNQMLTRSIPPASSLSPSLWPHSPPDGGEMRGAVQPSNKPSLSPPPLDGVQL